MSPLVDALPADSTRLDARFHFELPPELAAHEPPELRGLARDGVRLMVSRPGEHGVTHARFRSLLRFLEPGDLLVVNESATIPAALDALRLDAEPHPEAVELHLSTALDDGRWIVELRRFGLTGTRPLFDARAGERIDLRGTTLVLERTYSGQRLWVARVEADTSLTDIANRHGRPIRYDYVPREWPLHYYQTFFACTPGSAEMPSAGRPFSAPLVKALERAGVGFAPIVLHTGVSSLETDEPPYPERFTVPAATAHAANVAHATRRRVVAVGTTAVRAIESATREDGTVEAAHGWTDLVISQDRPPRAIDGIITGFHAPRASHLQLLRAIAGDDTVRLAYTEAVRCRYLWHEFGDAHLLFAR